MGRIVVEGVSKRFRLQKDRAHSLKELVTRRDRKTGADSFWALRDVSFEIEEGSMFALVGHNGSGKSTLLRCIAGIYKPTEGLVRVDGRISTLLELGAGFHPDLTGRENIYMNATILGMSKKEIDKKFDEIVAFAGIEPFIDSPVKVYSSGMYVRLGFSVAVHVRPDILIIDEVIAVGDEQFQRKCFDHLYGLRKQGVTIVVVTHGLGTVETMCDAAAWLDHGELQMTGNAGKVASAYLKRVNQVEADERAELSEHASLDEDDVAAEPWKAGFGEEIQITSVELADSSGTKVATATAGEDLTINIHYHAFKPIDQPVFGVLVHSENGAHVTGTNTQLAGFDTGVVKGSGVVGVTFRDLPLQPGYFDLTIGINDKNVQHVFDRHDREYQLVVRRGEEPPAAGFIRIEGDWTVRGSVEGESMPTGS